MFSLPEAWVWDFWLVDDGEHYHMFFLYASKALHDPNERHYRAAIGHAISRDLTNWERVTDALVHGNAPAFDETATWTGSVIRHPDGTWFMFYTGSRQVPGSNVQSIGFATSPDLLTWTKNAANPVLTADPRWYELLIDGQWGDEAFRDPFVFADPEGNGWHLLITARANHGAPDDRGVVGHAWSANLREWEIRPPLTAPGGGFGQLEVFQHVEIDGHGFLLFNTLSNELSESRRATGITGGVWAAPAAGPLGPFDIAGAHQLTDDSLYVGKIITVRETGEPQFLAFRNVADDGEFVGGVTDPLPVAVQDGALTVPGHGPMRTRLPSKAVG